MTVVLAFDLETVPDTDAGRRLHGLNGTDPEVAAAMLALRQEDKVRLWAAVNQLGDVHREVVLMRYGQEFSYEEIAETLEINIGTVKSRLFNAHKKLQEILTTQAPDLGRNRSMAHLLLLLAF